MEEEFFDLGMSSLSLGGGELIEPKLESFPTSPITIPPPPPDISTTTTANFSPSGPTTIAEDPLSLIDFPSANMRDGCCFLQGGAPVQFRFSLKISQQILKQHSQPINLVVKLFTHVSQTIEKLIEDGIKVLDPLPLVFDGITGIANVKLTFPSAGRGNLWIIRFIASQQQQQQEICHLDFNVRTFSKKAKIDQILYGGNISATTNQPLQQQIQQQRPSLSNVPPIPIAVKPEKTQVDDIWNENLEEDIRNSFNSINFTRKISQEEMEFIKMIFVGNGEFSGLEGTRNWVAKTVNEINRIPRLWNSDSPKLIHLITRELVEDFLKEQEIGSFILRFSQGEPGELVVAVKTINGTVENCYIRKESELLDEHSVVELVLSSNALRNLFDPESNTLFAKEIFRPRGRYSRNLIANNHL